MAERHYRLSGHQLTDATQSNSKTYGSRWAFKLAASLAVVLVTTPHLFALFPGNNLTAYLDLAGVKSTRDGETSRSLRQRINTNWRKSITPYLSLNSGLLLYRTDQDITHDLDLYQEELSPMARLSLAHPKVRVDASANRKETTGTLLLNELTRTGYSMNVSSLMSSLPSISSRYSHSRSGDDIGSPGQNAVSSDFNLNVADDFRDWSGGYRMTRNSHENVITQRKTVSWGHFLNAVWYKEVTYKKPIDLAGTARLSYSTSTNEVPLDSAIRLEIRQIRSLHASDQDPTHGQLQEESDLSDNDRKMPVDPAINIGLGASSQQVGADFLYEQSVGVVQVFTDQRSDDLLGWEVYVSKDGLNWERHDLTATSYFDISQTMYEIIFEAVSTQYIKVVSVGSNRVARVLVTEVRMLSSLYSNSRHKQSSYSHSATINASSVLSERWSARANLGYTHQPSVGLGSGRNSVFSELRAILKAKENLNHSFGLRISLGRAQGKARDYTEYVMDYNLNYEVLPTFRVNAASSAKASRFAAKRQAENIGFSGGIRAEPWPGLTTNLTSSYGISHQAVTDHTSGSWSTNFSIMGVASQSLSFSLDFGRQVVYTSTSAETVPRNQYGIMVSLRPVAKIQLSGQLDYSTGRYKSKREQVQASWTIMPMITISGQYQITDNSQGSITQRESVNFTWSPARRADIYGGYSRNRLAGLVQDTETISAGLRLIL